MAANEAAGYGHDKALARLKSLEQWLDPATIRHLRARGVGGGWRCLEVGGGAGSVARWLCGQVSPGGEVVATDIDTRFLETLSEANLRVIRHDVTADNLPRAAFDLVHCRLVLARVADRRAVLSKLAAALRPRGQLVAEEMDLVSATAGAGQPGARSFNAAVASCSEVLRGRGFDPSCGRMLLADFRAAGLADLGTEGHVRLWPGGSPGATVWRLTFEQLHRDMAAQGLDDAAAATAIGACQDPGFTFMSQVTMTAWGQRR